MDWKKDTPVILYGAAYMGGIVYDHLHTKVNFVAYIDKRANEILNYRNIPVYSMEKTPFLQKDKNNMIVLICVKNIFDHRKIAKELKKYGFSYIIDFSHPVFSKVVENTLTLPITVEQYKNEMVYDWQDSASILRKDGRVTARIPAPLVFTNIGEKHDIWSDWPIQSLYPHQELFSFFNGNINSNPYCYVKEYCIAGANRVGNKHITERWKQNVLESRQKVFYNMEKNWQLKTSFFIDNAPTAVWSNGKFNLTSGKHRAAFLAAKGEHFIPLNVTEQDYQAFLNIVVAREAMHFIEQEKIEDTSFSILHPYFYTFTSQSGFALYTILQKVLLYLGRDFLASGYSIQDLNILSASKYGAPFGRYFTQVGANVSKVHESGLENLLEQIYPKPQRNHSKIEQYDLIIEDMEQLANQAKARMYLLFGTNVEINPTIFPPEKYIIEPLLCQCNSEHVQWIVFVRKKGDAT